MSELNPAIEAPTPPDRRKMILEARVVADVARMTVPLLGASLRKRQEMSDRRVIVVPGFGADDRYTRPLRHFLSRRGHHAEGWGLGRNLAGLNLPHERADIGESWGLDGDRPYNGEGAVPYLTDRFAERVAERADELGGPITLIGWSLGGYVAREVARDLPDKVEAVVTLGSPIIGGPKYTAAAGVFQNRGLDLDWIEEGIRDREATPIRQPITAIYSRSDAIVSPGAAIDHHSENVKHIEVDASHLGLVFNPTVWRHILDSLSP